MTGHFNVIQRSLLTGDRFEGIESGEIDYARVWAGDQVVCSFGSITQAALQCLVPQNGNDYIRPVLMHQRADKAGRQYLVVSIEVRHGNDSYTMIERYLGLLGLWLDALAQCSTDADALFRDVLHEVALWDDELDPSWR